MTSTTIADQDSVCSSKATPRTAFLFPETCSLVLVDAYRYHIARTSLELNLGKSFQFLGGAIYGRLRWDYIQLHNLCTHAAARVRHSACDSDRCALGCRMLSVNHQVRDGERCIGQAVTERKCWCDFHCVEISIANVHVFAIKYASGFRTKVEIRRVILNPTWPR